MGESRCMEVRFVDAAASPQHSHAVNFSNQSLRCVCMWLHGNLVCPSCPAMQTATGTPTTHDSHRSRSFFLKSASVEQ